MDPYLIRNIEAFVALIDLPAFAWGRWLRAGHDRLAIHFEIVAEQRPEECLRLSVSVAPDVRELQRALADALRGAAPSTFCGVPVRFLVVRDRLVASVVMPRYTNVRQWFVVYSVIARKLRKYLEPGGIR